MDGPVAERAKQEPFHVVTPLLESWALSQVAGVPIFLKCENVQPSGSFKIRGIGHFCQEVRVCGQKRRSEGVQEGGKSEGCGLGMGLGRRRNMNSCRWEVRGEGRAVGRVRGKGVLGVGWGDSNLIVHRPS